MHVFKYNEYTKKYYKYDADEVDLCDPMFDHDLHNNRLTPMTMHPKICMYCNKVFSSRNQLFYHLGYMNIDIRIPINEKSNRTRNFRYKITKTKRRKNTIKPVLIEELLTELKL